MRDSVTKIGHGHFYPEMESSRPRRLEDNLVMSLALAFGAKSLALALALASDVVSLALASENMYLSLKYFSVL